MSEEKNFPNGWGNDEDDEDYGYSGFDDDEEDDSPFNKVSKDKSSASPFQNEDDDSAFGEPDDTPAVPQEQSSGDTSPVQPVNAQPAAPTPEKPAAPMPAAAPVSAPYQAGAAVKSKSSAVPVLIAIIAVLFIILGAIGVMFFMKNKSEKPGVESEPEAIVTTLAEAEEATAPTEETAAEAATEAVTEVKVSEAEINAAASKAVGDFKSKNADTTIQQALHDVNGDGVAELFITYMALSGDSVYTMYCYDGSGFKELKEFWGGLSICPEKHYIMETNYGGGTVYRYYELTEDNQINKFDEISFDPIGEYYRNGKSITAREYEAAVYFYDDMKWIEIEGVPINAVSPENTALSEYKSAIEAKISYMKANQSSVDLTYSLYDMDYDGTPELLLRYGFSEADKQLAIYTYKNGQLRTITDGLGAGHTSFGYDYVANQLVILWGHMGAASMSWYDLNSNGDLHFLIDTDIDFNNGGDYDGFMVKYNVAHLDGSSIWDYGKGYSTYIYSYNNGVYSSTDYSGKSYKYLEDKLSGTFTNPGRPANTSSASKYTTYDTSAATSDFQFNDGQFGYGGTVATEKDPLNLRAAPNSNAEIIIKMPKGSPVGIYGENSSWYYVSYTENGTTYYGYASRDYISASGI